MGNAALATRSEEDPTVSNVLDPDTHLLVGVAGGKGVSVEGGSLHVHIASAVERHLSERADWPLLENVLTGKSLYAREAFQSAKRFARVLQSYGIGPGDIVHHVVGNDNLAVVMAHAVWIVGGVTSMADVTLEASFIANQLMDSKAKLLICNPAMSVLAKEAKDLCIKHEFKSLCLGSTDWCDDLLELASAFDADDGPSPYIPEDPDIDVAHITWSSGTTGRPKGVCHSHTSLLNAMVAPMEMMEPGSAVVSTSGFYHAVGFTMALYSPVIRVTIHHFLGAHFTTELLLSTVRRVRPASFMTGVHQYALLARKADEYDPVQDEFKPEDLDSIVFIAPMGSPSTRSHFFSLKKLFPNLKAYLNCYGQSESGTFAQGYASDHVGNILRGVTIKVENVLTGERCGPNEEGEICTKSPQLMRYYLDRPEETAAFRDAEGFGHTGDLGYYDDQGRVFFVDRLKELIKYKNNYISPTELETLLLRHPSVSDCIVYGVPDETCQELVAAVVVLKPGHEEMTDDEDLMEFFDELVPDHKRLRGGIIFRDRIPRENLGKLMRKQMRDWARSLKTKRPGPIFEDRLADNQNTFLDIAREEVGLG